MNLPSALIDWLSAGERGLRLAAFQKRFLRGAFAPRVRDAALSCPRGAGKSSLLGHVAASFLSPDGPLHVPGRESVVMAASMAQARFVLQACRERLGLEARPASTRFRKGQEWSVQDSVALQQIEHLPSGARLRVLGGEGKRTMGLRNTVLAIVDEPGSHDARASEMQRDALMSSRKGDSPLRVLTIGTLAPGDVGSWWRKLWNEDTLPSEFRMLMQGERAKWEDWKHVISVNPLARQCPELRLALRDELAKAQRSPDARARFLSLRLNLPSSEARATLVTADQLTELAARPCPEREGVPILGVDLGASLSWAAAVAVYPNGRIECFARMPGTPGIEEAEARDGVPRGTYQRFADAGVLETDEGRNVVDVGSFVDAAMRRFQPFLVVGDEYKAPALKDALADWRVGVITRKMRYASATEDINASRQFLLDGRAAIAPECRGIVAFSIAEAVIASDQSGNMLLEKRRHSRSRDDIAQALALAAGESVREDAGIAAR